MEDHIEKINTSLFILLCSTHKQSMRSLTWFLWWLLLWRRHGMKLTTKSFQSFLQIACIETGSTKMDKMCLLITSIKCVCVLFTLNLSEVITNVNIFVWNLFWLTDINKFTPESLQWVLRRSRYSTDITVDNLPLKL